MEKRSEQKQRDMTLCLMRFASKDKQEVMTGVSGR
jgi:hypothetical protein